MPIKAGLRKLCPNDYFVLIDLDEVDKKDICDKAIDLLNKFTSSSDSEMDDANKLIEMFEHFKNDDLKIIDWDVLRLDTEADVMSEIIDADDLDAVQDEVGKRMDDYIPDDELSQLIELLDKFLY